MDTDNNGYGDGYGRVTVHEPWPYDVMRGIAWFGVVVIVCKMCGVG